MMKYLQKIGRSLMLPVACLPAAGILYGIGYWIDPAGWGSNSIYAAFCIKAASAIIDQIPLLFAIGTAIGMADDTDGTPALAGLVSWLMITTLLSTNAVAMYSGAEASQVPAAFGKIQNAFIGILAGLIGATCYNKCKDYIAPDWLAFFSGRRCVAIVTALVSALAAVILYYIWPMVYGALVGFGISIVDLGPLGAGLYAMLNRALIPLGLHHALNAVFWFDTAGINDLGLFWSGAEGAVKGTTGMYMTGFFPVMMFGLVAGAFAMYRAATPRRKKSAGGLLLAGAVASFFTGITEPIEFSFMFLAPGLYLLHAVLTGISAVVCAYLPVRCGFNFSAGMVDWILSFKAPMAVNPWLIIPVGLVFALIYYVVFSWAIKTFNLRTPGRELDDAGEAGLIVLKNNNFTETARAILEGLGGAGNLKSFDYCATRIRAEVDDYLLVDETKIKNAGVPGVIRPSEHNVQVVVGTKVQFVYDELKNLVAAAAK
ncbi:MAG: PTS transporter subunit EIIC [Synergistaceae bacterium]|nr:PTS transporter subunit EIIC [Synergistaceae bacterium]